MGTHKGSRSRQMVSFIDPASPAVCHRVHENKAAWGLSACYNLEAMPPDVVIPSLPTSIAQPAPSTNQPEATVH